MTTATLHLPNRERGAKPASPAPEAGAMVSSRSLLGGATTLVIEHMGMHYTLRATRNGKLILTK